MTKVLISGGSGLIGSNLTKNLELRGHQVAWLSRNPKKAKQESYYWNPEKEEIDLKCLEGTDCIVHLAGAGVTDKRWTKAYKQEIINSRVRSTQFLYHTLLNHHHRVNTFLGTSAVGYYGNKPSGICIETHPPGNTFLAEVCKIWENETLQINKLGIRTGIVRVGIVLAKEGGFLKEMSRFAKWGLASSLGDGKMITPWIEINDLSRIFLHLIENPKFDGIYNGVAPFPASNRKLMESICKSLHRPLWLPGIPEFVMKLGLGEMAPMLFASQQVSAKKIMDTGFKFQYTEAYEAINNLLKDPN